MPNRADNSDISIDGELELSFADLEAVELRRGEPAAGRLRSLSCQLNSAVSPRRRRVAASTPAGGDFSATVRSR